MTVAALRSRPWTLAGLAIALGGIPLVIFLYYRLGGPAGGVAPVLAREGAIFVLIALLLWIVLKREQLPLTSIGLSTERLGRSLLWGLAGAVLLAVGVALSLGLLHVLGLSYGSGGSGKLPIWAMLIVFVRAGIAEELFYRGYAIERIQALTGSRILAVLLPLACFALFHYRQGVAGVIIALILGAVMTGFYLWKRNLVANIFAHFLVDVVPNILLPLLAGAG
jgi:membrane protease YdiL (CAAX protease family)